jgi:outer membrane protein
MKSKIWITGLIMGLAMGSSLLAQGTTAQKVGVISYFRALVECAEGKIANDEFQKKLEARKSELQRKQSEIQALQQQLETQRQTLNEDSLVVLNKNIQLKSTDLQRAQEDSEKEFNLMRSEILERIGRKMGPIVQKYAQENNFSLLLDGSSQTSQLLFVNSTLDVTSEIIKRYDAANPPSSTAATATPAKK